MSLSNYTNQELIDELRRRGVHKLDEPHVPMCRCGKYRTYAGISRSWYEESHCEGCHQLVENCHC